MNDLTPVLAETVTFDYSALPADVASDARAVAERIRSHDTQAYAAAVEIGHELIHMRDRLEHGQFLAWIEAECGFSKTAAYRSMDVAERLPDKLPTVGSLPLTAAYKVAARSTPEPVRQEVVRRIEAGEWLATATVKDMVLRAKHAEREAKVTAEERKKRELRARRERRSKEQREAEWKRQEEERKAERQRRFGAAETAAALVLSKIGDDLERLASSLRDAEIRDFVTLIAEAAGVAPSEWWNMELKRNGIHREGAP